MNGYITVNNNKKIYYGIYGESHLPVFLYLHGGPGAGSYDFEKLQSSRLSKFMRIIAIDQRGVLRSDSIKDDESFGILDLIEDCEVIREHLNVRKWGIIAHSFGGYIATKYLINHPKKITELILECPTFDLGSSARSLLQGASKEFKLLGDEKKACECLKAIKINDSKLVWEEFSELSNHLAEHRDNLYVHGEDKHFFDNIIENSNIPMEHWEKSMNHQMKIFQEGKVFESLLTDLKQITTPMLVIKGKYDLVTSDDQISVVDNGNRNHIVSIFKHSGHFPRFEEPELYAKKIHEFISREKTR